MKPRDLWIRRGMQHTSDSLVKVVLSVCALIAFGAHAAVLVGNYEFSSGENAWNSQDLPGVASPMQPSDGNVTTGGDLLLISSSSQPTTYAQFTINLSETGLNLNGGTVRLDTVQLFEPGNWEVRSAFDNYSTALGSGTTSQSTWTFNLNFGQPVTETSFRLYGWTSGGSQIGFDNVQVSAVPEPVNVALAGFGLTVAAIGITKRLRRTGKS